MAEATTVATPYTSNQGASQDQLTMLSNNIQKGYSELPSLRQSIADQVASQEGMLQPLQEQKAGMIQQLFEHDKNYSANTASPTSAGFIENPMARSAGLNAEQAPIWAAISKLSGDITSRRAMLGNAISSTVEARKLELQAMSDYYDRLVEYEKIKAAEKGVELKEIRLNDRVELRNALTGELVQTIPMGGTTEDNSDLLKGDGKTTTQTGTTLPAATQPIETGDPIKDMDERYPTMSDADKQKVIKTKQDNGVPLTQQQMDDAARFMRGGASGGGVNLGPSIPNNMPYNQPKSGGGLTNPNERAKSPFEGLGINL